MQYLEEFMNCGSFKLLHRHVVANDNVFIGQCLLESVLSETFTSKEGHRTTIRRANRRRLGSIYVRTNGRSIDFRLGHKSSVVKNHDRSGGQHLGANLLLLVTSTARKITCVQPLGHRLPFLRRGWKDEFRCRRDRRTSWAISPSPDCVTSSATTPFPLFSFMVAIPTKKKDALGST